MDDMCWRKMGTRLAGVCSASCAGCSMANGSRVEGIRPWTPAGERAGAVLATGMLAPPRKLGWLERAPPAPGDTVDESAEAAAAAAAAEEEEEAVGRDWRAKE